MSGLNQASSEAIESYAFDDHARRARAEAVYGTALWSSALYAVNAGIVSLAHRDSVALEIILAWLGWMLLASVVRLAIWLKFQRTDKGDRNTSFWFHATMFSALISGIGWGAAAILFLSHVSPVMDPANATMAKDVITIVFVAGMSAGALASFGPILPAFSIYVITSLLPVGILLALKATEPHLLMSVTAGIYLVFLLYSARRYNVLFDEIFRTGFENEKLVEQLRAARDELEQNVIERTGELRRTVVSLEKEMAERQIVERQLAQAQKMEAVGQLTGGIAHDFNNLLTVVFGNLESVRTLAIDQAKILRHTEIAYRAAKRGAELTWRLLAFSRQQPLQPMVTDPGRLLHGMEDMLRRTLGETISLQTDAEPGLWSIHADQAGLENAILNLVINASDAMPDGGTLRITLRNEQFNSAHSAPHDEDPTGPCVAIRVADTGGGMDAESVERAFDPFFTTKDVDKGSGLGLSMVHGFVRQSGGYAVVESEPGRGTTVTMAFPRSNPESGMPVSQTEVENHVRPEHGGAETILVVEDDIDVRELLVAQLTDLGYRVLDTRDGPSAMALLQDTPDIDLLFTDITLPGGMDGRDIAREFRRQRPDSAAMLCTGYAENFQSPEGVPAGLDLLAKPYTLEELSTRVRRALDERPFNRSA